MHSHRSIMWSCGLIKDGNFIEGLAEARPWGGKNLIPYLQVMSYGGGGRMQHVHFIGVGGYSMSGLALLLHRQGYKVTGSDMKRSTRTERLEAAGIEVSYAHQAELVFGADLVVYNTDVPIDNPERQAADDHHIRVIHRSEVLAEALAPYRAVTVSGTHGKTTTTSMIGTILQQAQLDPTILVGGEVPQFDGNLRVGKGPYAVAEADESDGTFLRYNPFVAVATNVEPEHLDHYQGNFENLKAAFERYASSVPSDGLAVLGVDNAVLRDLAKRLSVPICTYGVSDEAMVRAVDIESKSSCTRFFVQVNGARVGQAELTVPGLHNVVNALGAMAASHHVGVDWSQAMEHLRQFTNAARRFQVLLEGPIRVVDDYAHHPTEIRSTLKAARQVSNGRVVALFQPQRYVRTQNLWDQFIDSFQDADQLYLTDIYAPPGESPIAGINGASLAEAIARRHGRSVRFYSQLEEAIEPIFRDLTAGDTFITMGAGNVYLVAQRIVDQIRAQ